MEKSGVARALYTEWKNVYAREPTAKELLHGTPAVTQFARVCERLGLKIIAAGSPEAKDRVERNHGTHQDRLVEKKIATRKATNDYLETEYCDEHYQRFAVDAGEEVDFSRPRPRPKKSNWRQKQPHGDRVTPIREFCMLFNT